MDFIPPEVTDSFYRMLVAALFGALVGLERDIHGRAAGLRTHLLVSLGSAVFMILSEQVGSVLQGGATVDPSRIAAQIVTGIGFLGAGVIIKAGVNVRGLTTAACLWTAAGIGMAAGAGLFTLSGLTTVIALVSLVGLKAFERFYQKDFYRVLKVTTPLQVYANEIIEVVSTENISVINWNIKKNYELNQSVTTLSLRLHHIGPADEFAESVINSLEKAPLHLKEVAWTYS